MVGAGQVVQWLRGAVPGMRLSRIKTLGSLVAAAMKMRGVGVLALGRSMEGPVAAKHRIKRAWRFLRNEGVEQLEVSRGIFAQCAPRQGSIVVLCDWTDLTPFQQLVFSLPRDGRSMPFLSVTISKMAGEGAMRSSEGKALALLAQIVPQGRRVIVVADRGFGNGRWLSHVKTWGWSYVQRIAGNLTVSMQDYDGAVEAMPIMRGAACRDWGATTLTKERGLRVRCISVWASDAKEPWVLVTDLQDMPAAEVIRLYKRRMWIEATFRDLKNRTWGLSLDATRLSEAKRHDRLFLVVALAYALLSAFGAIAEHTKLANTLKANTVDYRVMSLARIGNYCIGLASWTIHQALTALGRLPS